MSELCLGVGTQCLCATNVTLFPEGRFNPWPNLAVAPGTPWFSWWAQSLERRPEGAVERTL